MRVTGADDLQGTYAQPVGGTYMVPNKHKSFKLQHFYEKYLNFHMLPTEHFVSQIQISRGVILSPFYGLSIFSPQIYFLPTVTKYHFFFYQIYKNEKDTGPRGARSSHQYSP